MKKISLFVTALAISQFMFAQGVQFGIKGGVNIASLNDEDRVPDAQVKSRLGFHVGGLAHIHLSDKWALQPEVTYSKEGADYDFPSYTGKTDLNYINVPVLVQYMMGSGFRLETGPQIGFLTSAKYENASNSESIKDDVSKTNFSWGLGLGYITKSGFGVDARFNLGLSNLYKDGVYPGQEAKSRVGQIGVFYQFNK
jgi:hypothetical protein